MRTHPAALIVPAHLFAALLGLFLSTHPIAAQEASAAGLWQQIDPDSGKSKGWFYIYEHGDTYEGAIVKMFLNPGDSPNPVCTNCPGEQQGAPWLGLTIIKGMVRNGLKYDNGSILDPIHGQEWNSLMRLSPDGQDLTVRGYLKFDWLGQNQYWKRLADACVGQLDPTITAKFKMNAPKAGAPLPKGRPPTVC
jgi:uncharacterized protein (DUF2147 family)